MNTAKRFYLNCPYAEKDDAKDLGAKWDQGARKWFVPDDIDTDLFRKWWPEEVAAAIAFLLSPPAAAIVGACLFVDGGTDAMLHPRSPEGWEVTGIEV